jgi:AraC-like DNA-binding protein
MSLMNNPPINSKKALVILILAPILVFCITFLIIQKPDIDFFNPDFKYRVATDEVTGRGKSEIAYNYSKQGLKFNYTLREGDPYPFIYVSFTEKNHEAFNTEGYILNFGIESDSVHELDLRIGLVLDGYTVKDDFDSYTFVEKTIPIAKGKNHFQIPLDEITRTPSWWYTRKNFTEYDIPFHSKNKTGYIAIYDVKHKEININRNLQITEFKIHPTYHSFYTYSAVVLFFYVGILFLGYKFRSRKSDKILVPIDFSVDERKEKNYADLIIQYLAQNFSNPNLKLEDIAKEIGLTENQISFELKAYSGKTFKSYLNFIRIEKAKKLLLESDLQVSEIAFEVGYNSAHHFIRVFKELEEASPSGFRKASSQREM